MIPGQCRWQFTFGGCSMKSYKTSRQRSIAWITGDGSVNQAMFKTVLSTIQKGRQSKRQGIPLMSWVMMRYSHPVQQPRVHKGVPIFMLREMGVPAIQRAKPGNAGVSGWSLKEWRLVAEFCTVNWIFLFSTVHILEDGRPSWVFSVKVHSSSSPYPLVM